MSACCSRRCDRRAIWVWILPVISCWIVRDVSSLTILHAAYADFSQRVAMPKGLACDHPVAFFPGSSIGNFTLQETEPFLHSLHSMLPGDSGLLIGVDLIKDATILNAAYNDVAG